MIVNKDELIKAMDLLTLIPSRAGIPASEYIRIDEKPGLVIMSLASDALGRVKAAKAGSWPTTNPPFFVDRHIFGPFISAAKYMKSKADFEFEDDNGGLRLKQGRRKVTFPVLPEVTGYGSITPEKDSVELQLTDRQKELIQCAESCATTDPIAPQLNAVYLNEDGLVLSTNRIILFSAKTAKFDQAIPMPLFLLKLLGVDGVKKLIFSKKQVILEFDYGKVLQTVPQQALKSFPSKKILSRLTDAKDYDFMFSVDAAKLSTVFDRFGGYMQSARRQEKVITLETFTGKKDLRVSATVSKAELVESIRMDEPATTDSKAEWSLELIQPVIKFLGSKKQKITVSSSKDCPYYLQGGDVSLILARKIE